MACCKCLKGVPSYLVDMLRIFQIMVYYWLLQIIYQLDKIELCQQLIVHLYMYLYHSIIFNIPNIGYICIYAKNIYKF